MKPTIEQFKNVVDQFEYIDWFGEYHGRFYYEGIGVTAGSLGDIATLMVEMKSEGFNLPKWDHQDSLGMGSIVAWRKSKFADSTERVEA
ncbi:hypothetical protein [Hyphomonas sp.]|uniref:hypothetical protein n=1 Tax=Hyphomonas sp. TaxID=87 RepID=UPI000C996A5E|nr:hypothetical protein [Hyphomonas sp.]MAL45931.1 hypothetical protein [Hyphomonas sp.]|tara:strand:+ start:78 stop:344 length:267 start_codon:yes stop_codon:yes gene_type:complete